MGEPPFVTDTSVFSRRQERPKLPRQMPRP